MFILFKHNSNISNITEKRELHEKELSIIEEVKSQLKTIPVEVKMQLGVLLFEVLTDEFSYIFPLPFMNP